MTSVFAPRLAQVFVEIADTLVDEFDVIDFLQMLAEHTADLLGGSPVGLLLADQQGRLEFVAASNENVKILELFQVQNHEGPCLDAFRTGEPVINADLQGAADRWPLFSPRAVQAGFRSVHAFPLRLRADRIGAMNVFGTDVGARLAETDAQIVQALADVAAIGLLQARAASRGEQLTEQLQGALNSRIVIEQAKGAVAQLRGVSVDDAFALIRAYSRSRNLRLGDVSRAVIEDPASVPALSEPRQPDPTV